MDKLYAYLKEKLKQKIIHLDQFAQMCEISKSTLYRYMKGILIMPEGVENKVASILDFDSDEREKLHKLIYKAYADNTIVNANERLYKYIFSPTMGNDSNDFELVLHKGTRYINSIEDIFKDIFKMSSTKNFMCEIKIIGCTDEKIIKIIQKFVNNKKVKSNAFRIEHIVNIPNSFYNDIIQTFEAVFPLMMFFGYNLYYTSFDSEQMYLSVVNDCLIIKCSSYEEINKTDEKYIFVNFIKNRFSGCYVSRDRNLYNFFIQNYEYLKQKCYKSSIKVKNINSLIDKYETIEKGRNVYLVQASPNYNRIPMEVWDSELLQYCDEELIQLVNFISSKSNNLETAKEYINHMKEVMSKRILYTKSNKSIDIYTKEGIKNFISTGYLYNNNPKLKPFSKKSIRTIINYLIQRSLNGDDNYKMYISTNSVCDKAILRIIENWGIIITYNFSSEESIITSDSYIKNKSVYKIYSKFMENCATTINMMTNEESYNYIQGLLKTYC